MWKRLPEKDRRIRNGDDHAGDAWLNTETQEIRYVAVGYDLGGMEYAKRKLAN